MQPQEPGFQVAREHLGVGPLLGRGQHGQGQPVHGVLRLALLGEGVEQLREVRQGERDLEPALAGAEGGAHQLALAQPEELGPLAPVEADAHLAQRLQGRLVAWARAPRPLRHRPHLPALAREQDDHLARLAELVRAQDESIRGDGRHEDASVARA